MVSHPVHLPLPVLPTQGRQPERMRPVEAELLKNDEFLKAMLETPFSRHVHMNPLDWVVSFIVHLIVIAALIIAPLYFTDVIDLKAFTQTLLVGPPPPAPPPPAAAPVKIVPRAPVARFMQAGHLSMPVAIPKGIAMVKEEPLPPDTGADGVIGGVPGGIPGGQIGGVLGGIIGGVKSGPSSIALPPPPVHRVVRVGGNIKAPRLIYQPDFIYPPIARAARVQGEVLVEAIIDETGKVVEAHAVSGPGLLVPAALQAVAQWRYEPTLLNGEPVSVHMTVHVNYRLD